MLFSMDVISYHSYILNYIRMNKMLFFLLKSFYWLKMDRTLAGPIVILIRHRIKKYWLRNMGETV